jgi:hypothetical protein
VGFVKHEFELSKMANLEKYRAHARYCELMAQKAAHPEDRQAWKTLGETWRDLLPPFERAPAIEPAQASSEPSTPW